MKHIKNNYALYALIIGLFLTASAQAATYNGHDYSLTTVRGTWVQAEAEAVLLGGHLVTINDAAEQTFIVNTFLAGTDANRALWIGLNDMATEGTFVWSSGEPKTYTFWEPGEPTNSNNTEDYVAINSHFAAGFTTTKGTWNDVPLNGPTGVGNANGPYFGIIEILSPSAASVTVAGRVRTPNGRGLVNAYVTLTDSSGNSRLARTTAFGYFHFEDVAAGETYIVGVFSKRYRFTSQVLSVNQDIADLELTGENLFFKSPR